MPLQSEWPPGSGEMAGRVRDLDWSQTPLGGIEGWPERVKVLVEQVLDSPLVASLACGPERVLIYNDAAAALYGTRHPVALGRPLSATFPESWPVGAVIYDRVFAGERLHLPAQPLDVRGELGRAPNVFDAYLTPVRDGNGTVVAAHMIGFEIGGRLRAEAALRDSEERQAFHLELSDTLRPLADPVDIMAAASKALGRYLDAGRCGCGEVDETGEWFIVERD